MVCGVHTPSPNWTSSVPCTIIGNELVAKVPGSGIIHYMTTENRMTREQAFRKELKELLTKYDVDVSVETKVTWAGSLRVGLEFHSPTRWNKENGVIQEGFEFTTSPCLFVDDL